MESIFQKEATQVHWSRGARSCCKLCIHRRSHNHQPPPPPGQRIRALDLLLPAASLLRPTGSATVFQRSEFAGPTITVSLASDQRASLPPDRKILAWPS